LSAGVRAFAPDDDPCAVEVPGQVEHAGQFGDLGACPQRAVLFQGQVPEPVGQGSDRTADRLGDG
jgi:hypothetical protein